MLDKLKNGIVEDTQAEQVNDADILGCCWLEWHEESLGNWTYL